jgi:hypothetical protein
MRGVDRPGRIGPLGQRVEAPARAPEGHIDWGFPLADYNDPANGRSIFQARYSVRWREILPEVPRCRVLSGEIEVHRREQRDLQRQLSTADRDEKPYIIAQISDLDAAIRAKQAEMRTLGCPDEGPPRPNAEHWAVYLDQVSALQAPSSVLDDQDETELVFLHWR